MSTRRLNMKTERHECRGISVQQLCSPTISSLQSNNSENVLLKRPEICTTNLFRILFLCLLILSAKSANKDIDYEQILKCNKERGFVCNKCKCEINPIIKAIIGAPAVTSIYGLGSIHHEEQFLMSENELRDLINELYENTQSQKNDKLFDLMIFRELRTQLFWNCIFYFLHYNLPYDCILPYLEEDLIKWLYTQSPIEIGEESDSYDSEEDIFNNDNL